VADPGIQGASDIKPDTEADSGGLIRLPEACSFGDVTG
tara:strand:- start:137 stop:250 length:114 start_codon:yes stop_codon:yes gene_type:complete